MFGKSKQFIQSLIISSVAAILIMTGLVLSIVGEVNRSNQTDRIRTIEKFVEFRADVEGLFADNIMLIRGYIAYLQTFNTFDGSNSEYYLDKLLSDHTDLIRSVTIIRDTTIIYAYPSKGNEAAIGKDLALVPDQRDGVLYAKNAMETVFQGPVDLVQGGTGIISRIPIKLEGVYWGQISIVLDGEKFIDKINEYAKAADIQVALFRALEYPEQSFNNSVDIMSQKPIIMEMLINNIQWKAAVLPKDGWKQNVSIIIFWSLMTAGLSLVIGYMIFQTLYSRMLLKSEAVTDHLTGLFNRNFLEDYEKLLLGRADRMHNQVAAVLIDLNKFKVINDQYGHKAGDIVLMTVASRLKIACRDTEAVIRLGGDEFLLLFPDISNRSIMDPIIKRLKNTISQPIPYKGHTHQVGASMGVAMYPEDGTSVDAIIQKADEMMYLDKSNQG